MQVRVRVEEGSRLLRLGQVPPYTAALSLMLREGGPSRPWTFPKFQSTLKNFQSMRLCLFSLTLDPPIPTVCNRGGVSAPSLLADRIGICHDATYISSRAG